MRTVLGVALVASLLGNLVLLYRVLDLGVTTTYGADEINRRAEQAAAAQQLLPLLLPHVSRKDLTNAADLAGLEILDKGQEGVYVGGIEFVFSDDQLAAVEFH